MSHSMTHNNESEQYFVQKSRGEREECIQINNCFLRFKVTDWVSRSDCVNEEDIYQIR